MIGYIIETARGERVILKNSKVHELKKAMKRLRRNKQTIISLITRTTPNA